MEGGWEGDLMQGRENRGVVEGGQPASMAQKHKNRRGTHASMLSRPVWNP